MRKHYRNWFSGTGVQNIWRDNANSRDFFHAVYCLAELALECLKDPNERISAAAYSEKLKHV